MRNNRNDNNSYNNQNNHYRNRKRHRHPPSTMTADSDPNTRSWVQNDVEEDIDERAHNTNRSEQLSSSSATSSNIVIDPLIQQYTENDDPFPHALRCSRIVAEDSHQYPILDWYTPRDAVPISMELTLIPLLIQYGKNERGMFKTQPQSRLTKLQNTIHQLNSSDSHNGGSICLYQALSLRRHHIKQSNLSRTMTQLGLGSDDDIQTSANLLERAIEQFLVRNHVQMYNEAHQKDHIRQNKPFNEPYPPTPDFVLHNPITIRTYRLQEKNEQPQQNHQEQEREDSKKAATENNSVDVDEYHHPYPTNEKVILQQHTVSWIEVKMFYGASTIPNDNRSAVGCILTTARKYVKCHGPGAMIFLYGYGDELAKQLLQLGVLPLDCSYLFNNLSAHSGGSSGNEEVDVVELHEVIAHQKRWCANSAGVILP